MNIKSLIILSALLLMGCESDKKLTTNTVNNSSIKNSSVKQYPGKPHAAIEMSYSVDKNLVAGKEIEITLTFVNTSDVDDLLINFKLDDGLVSNDTLQHSFGALTVGNRSVITLRVTAASNDLYYINVLATLITDRNQSRSFTIPINVGNVDARKKLKPMGKVIIDSSGRRIIKMPATMRKPTKDK